jgi:TPR repeat protein
LVAAVVLVSSCAYLRAQQPTMPAKCEMQELATNAALGDPLAQHHLGVEFHRGVSVPQDLGKAAAMWRLSSGGGVVESFNNLGYLTYYGKGVRQDFGEGLRLWRIAAEKGFAESQVHLGYAYTDGRHLRRDYVEAHAWASVGKQSAQRIADAEMRKSVVEMADKLLAGVTWRLSEAQMREAEKKAAEYVAKFDAK